MCHAQPASAPICGMAETCWTTAQAFEPIHISKVAEKLQLGPDDYNLYGTTKAKARHPTLRKPSSPFKALLLTTLMSAGVQQVKLCVLDRLKTAPNGKYGERPPTSRSRRPSCVKTAACRP